MPKVIRAVTVLGENRVEDEYEDRQQHRVDVRYDEMTGACRLVVVAASRRRLTQHTVL